jgi:hypothetical protein
MHTTRYLVVTINGDVTCTNPDRRQPVTPANVPLGMMHVPIRAVSVNELTRHSAAGGIVRPPEVLALAAGLPVSAWPATGHVLHERRPLRGGWRHGQGRRLHEARSCWPANSGASTGQAYSGTGPLGLAASSTCTGCRVIPPQWQQSCGIGSAAWRLPGGSVGCGIVDAPFVGCLRGGGPRSPGALACNCRLPLHTAPYRRMEHHGALCPRMRDQAAPRLTHG